MAYWLVLKSTHAPQPVILSFASGRAQNKAKYQAGATTPDFLKEIK